MQTASDLKLEMAESAWRACQLAGLATLAARLLVAPAIASCPCATGTENIRQIDPYPVNAAAGTRAIADLANGGTVALSDSQLIDIVILGDGYTESETNDFFSDACQWYRDLFCAEEGIPPYNTFAQAFRVRAVFNASDQAVGRTNDEQRVSYFRVKAGVNTDGTVDGVASVDGWWNAAGGVNEEFRSRLFAAIDSVTDSVTPAVNAAQYPSDLHRPSPESESYYFLKDGDEDTFDYLPALFDRYSNLFVVMLMRWEAGGSAGGTSKQVCSKAGCVAGSRRVMVAFGESAKHEFNHAFADLFDEYIQKRETDAKFHNPDPPSVFLLWNVSFTNAPCDSLWPHLAPGGYYNPNVRSPIGRLYQGGYCATNVWHAEYFCLMNGEHKNYACEIATDAPVAGLRSSNLCFWCEEVVAVRILEKTGQFTRPGDPGNVNVRGQTWYQLWEASLRDAYYRRFDVAARIAAKTEAYATSTVMDGNGDFLSFAGICGCDIVEYGNAIYVDSGEGNSSNPGTRNKPLDTLILGIAAANARCASAPLVAIQPGTYAGPMTLSQRTIIVTDVCGSVLIGK